MTPVGVKPAEPVADASAGTPPVGAAVVGGAIGAVAGAIVAGPAGALVGGAVGAAGGAVVAKSGPGEDRVIDIDRPEMSGTIRRPRDEDMDSGF